MGSSGVAGLMYRVCSRKRRVHHRVSRGAVDDTEKSGSIFGGKQES
jgi:hypothetical protein